MSADMLELPNNDKWKKSRYICPHCEHDSHYYLIVESDCGGYEDERHECRICGKTWWIDGIDS